MAPNLAVALMTIFTPSRWRSSHGKSKSADQSGAETEHWSKPTPGLYEYFPGAGWYLVQRDGESERLDKPDRVIWSDALDRKLLLSDYTARSRTGKLPLPRQAGSSSRNNSVTKLPPAPGSTKEKIAAAAQQQQQKRLLADAAVRPDVHFVRLDDGVTWVNDKDAQGAPTKAPWPRFCIDKETGEFRAMTVGDDPKRSRPSSARSKSVSASARNSDENVADGKKSGNVSRSSSAARRTGPSAAAAKMGEQPSQLKEEKTLEEA